MAGCNLLDPFFVRVEFIEGVPETGSAGTPLTLTGNVRPAFASNKDIVWSVKESGTTGASISGNILNVNAEGTITIRAKIANGTAQGKEFTQDFEIVFGEGGAIGDAAVTGVTLNHEEITLNIESTYTLTATVSPSNAANKTVTWSSDETGVATVNNGVVTARNVGTATITVTTADGGFTATCRVTVVESGAPVMVTGVSLNHTTLSMTVDSTATLIATVLPTNATNKNVTWRSDEEGVATVNNGVVTARAADTVTITVTTVDGGFTAACVVTINKDEGAAVSAPTVNGSPTRDSITVNAVSPPANGQSVEYAISTESNGTGLSAWQSGTTFTGLNAGTIYYVYARSASDSYHYNAGTPSVSVGITTAGGSITSPTGIVMVSIPAGTFTMGSPTTEPNRNSDETQHSVTLSGFSISKYQVTQAQWLTVMGKTIVEQQALATTSTTDYGRGGNYPIYYVSWYDTIVFCNKLSLLEGLEPVYSISGKTNPSDWGDIPTNNNSTWNAVVMDKSKNGYRLPTEAEWEYTCRAGTTTAYNTGNTISDNTGWYTSNSGGKSHAVGLKPANAWGLYDMHGNLLEWCWDWYGSYSSSAQTDPLGASSGSDRGTRGGDWYDSDLSMRSARRNYYSPYGRSNRVGFRLVRP
jgi:formylglycine-generating enzyme required for sulfatase activity/uncharacterized protein YjdB